MKTLGIAGTYDDVDDKSADVRMEYLSKNVAKRLLDEFETDAEDSDAPYCAKLAREVKLFKPIDPTNFKAEYLYNFIYEEIVMDKTSTFIEQDLATFALDCVSEADLANLYDDILVVEEDRVAG